MLPLTVSISDSLFLSPDLKIFLFHQAFTEHRSNLSPAPWSYDRMSLYKFDDDDDNEALVCIIFTTTRMIEHWSYAPLRPEQPRCRELGPSSEDGLSLSAVPTCGTVFLCLSAPSTPTCPSAVLSKLICSSLRLTINCYFTIFWLCNARSARFYLVWLSTKTFYHIISYDIIVQLNNVFAW